MSFYKSLTRKKLMNDFGETKLVQVLSSLDLTALGVGSTLGVGVYVLAGAVSKLYAGPAVIISFLIAAIASIFAGLCYAEFGARVPKAGSAYVYCYVTIGEFVAFLIGWNLILEYSIGAASVVKGLSTYVDSLIENRIQKWLLEYFPMNVSGLSEFPDVFAFAITMLFTITVAFGAKESSRLNNIFTLTNLSVVIYVIVAGAMNSNPENWKIPPENVPEGYGVGGFMPYGFNGIVRGAAVCFYGFIGFDCIATAGEEAKNPKRSMPISIIGSLTIVFLAYFGISTVLTMMIPYYDQDPDAPLPYVFERYNMTTAKYIVSFGAIFGLCASLMGAMFPLPRIIYAMASDGLIFGWMGTINKRFHTPLYGTLFAGFLTAIISAILNLTQLVSMMSIGTLIAYTIVASCVLLLRYEIENENETLRIPAPFLRNINRFLWNTDNVHAPTRLTSIIATWGITLYCLFCMIFCFCIVILSDELLEYVWWAWSILIVFGLCFAFTLAIIARQPTNKFSSSFQVPWVPWLPAFSILINSYLMMLLDLMTWVRFVVWITIGLAIYFSYGLRNSVVKSQIKRRKEINDNIKDGKVFATSREILVPTGQ